MDWIAGVQIEVLAAVLVALAGASFALAVALWRTRLRCATHRARRSFALAREQPRT